MGLLTAGLLVLAVPLVASAQNPVVQLSYKQGCSQDDEPPSLLIEVAVNGFSQENALLDLIIPPGVLQVICDPAPAGPDPLLKWWLAPLSGYFVIHCELRVAALGGYPLTVAIQTLLGGEEVMMTWNLGASANPLANQDGDLLPDCRDPYPEDAWPCGDLDYNGYDDCTGEHSYDEDCCDEGCVKVHDPRSGLCPATVGGRTRVPREIAWSLVLLLLFLRRNSLN
ncbi:MAG: hypothetical protein CVU65_18585 [Deltaproteobacteria bacterium HGW-Deltaproteobacteria-22]|nr:MAG: hypothetical protein CVU65_18585 [Deltaproteobacteria bacterium HGW-Deltaproteobacteria-22]